MRRVKSIVVLLLLLFALAGLTSEVRTTSDLASYQAPECGDGPHDPKCPEGQHCVRGKCVKLRSSAIWARLR
jgi:hypothetical protein